MFKLVGSELFEISGDDEQVHAKCEILINASTGFTYEYSLFVNGKQLKKFKEKQSKIMRTWVVELNQQMWRITLGSYSHFTLLYIRPLFFLMSSSLEKESLDIWVNGLKAETTHEFTDEGTEMQFEINGEHKASIRTISSGNKKEGIVYALVIDDKEIKESFE